MRTLLCLLMIASVVPLAAASTTQDMQGQFLAANPLDPEFIPEVVWDVDDELLAPYPAVRRALADLHNLVPVHDEEVASTEAFLAELDAQNTFAVRYNGTVYQVGVAMASLPMEEGELYTTDDGVPAPTSEADPDGVSRIVLPVVTGGIGLALGAVVAIALLRRS